MKTEILLVILLSLFPACAKDSCILKGRWQSNEKATLEQMEKYGGVTEKQRQLFTNNFFGKLVVEYTCTEVTLHSEGGASTGKYKIIRKEGNVLKVRFYDEVPDDGITRTIILYGDCYQILPLLNVHFNEVFCRVK
jgi:hypothetical protein